MLTTYIPETHDITSAVAMGVLGEVSELPLSLGQITLGLVTVLTYSLGLAASLTAIGIVAVEAGRRARQWLPSDQALLWLPLFSGLLVAATGAWLLQH